jgi:hypothetical protein
VARCRVDGADSLHSYAWTQTSTRAHTASAAQQAAQHLLQLPAVRWYRVRPESTHQTATAPSVVDPKEQVDLIGHAFEPLGRLDRPDGRALMFCMRACAGNSFHEIADVACVGTVHLNQDIRMTRSGLTYRNCLAASRMCRAFVDWPARMGSTSISGSLRKKCPALRRELRSTLYSYSPTTVNQLSPFQPRFSNSPSSRSPVRKLRSISWLEEDCMIVL